MLWLTIVCWYVNMRKNGGTNYNPTLTLLYNKSICITNIIGKLISNYANEWFACLEFIHISLCLLYYTIMYNNNKKKCMRGLWLTAGRWFPPGTVTNKTDRHDMAEILLKLALNFITVTLGLCIFIFLIYFLFIFYFFYFLFYDIYLNL